MPLIDMRGAEAAGAFLLWCSTRRWVIPVWRRCPSTVDTLNAAYAIGDNGSCKLKCILVNLFDVDSCMESMDVRTSWQLREAMSTE